MSESGTPFRAQRPDSLRRQTTGPSCLHGWRRGCGRLLPLGSEGEEGQEGLATARSPPRALSQGPATSPCHPARGCSEGLGAAGGDWQRPLQSPCCPKGRRLRLGGGETSGGHGGPWRPTLGKRAAHFLKQLSRGLHSVKAPSWRKARTQRAELGGAGAVEVPRDPGRLGAGSSAAWPLSRVEPGLTRAWGHLVSVPDTRPFIYCQPPLCLLQPLSSNTGTAHHTQTGPHVTHAPWGSWGAGEPTARPTNQNSNSIFALRPKPVCD